MDSPEGKGRAFVTGASAGIGATFAQRLAVDGNDLILVARRRDRLDALAEQLDRETSASVEVLVADLADPEGLARAEDRAGRGDVTILVNNAGFGGYGPFTEIDPDLAEAIVRVHVLAPVHLTRAALPSMVDRGEGAIISVASMLAFSGTMLPNPLPHRATYAGAKSFLVTFTQALAGELAGSGVRAMVCVPGIVATEFHEVMGMDLSFLPRMSPEDVVRGALAALERGEVVCLPPVEDASLFEAVSEAQRALYEAAEAKLASRYRG